MTADDDRTPSERLEDALHSAVAELVPVIGLPPLEPGGPRVRPDLDGCDLADLERLPAGAVYAAGKALDLVALALAVLQGDLDEPVSVEEGLAILDRQRPC